jgi:LAO/AO transport system kinase
LTGDGVPELLAALDRHRLLASTPGSAARQARAAAQVWSLVGDRVRDRLSDGASRAATEAVLREVAEQHLDPFAAADRLLAQLRA